MSNLLIIYLTSIIVGQIHYVFLALLFLFANLLFMYLKKEKKYIILVNLFFILALFNLIKMKQNMPDNIEIIEKGEFIEKNIIKSSKYKFKVFNNKYQKGDIVFVEGRMIKIPSPKNPYDFNERMYYKIKGVDYSFKGRMKLIKRDKNFTNYIRKKISEKFDTILPDKESSIIKAMILGDKEDLSLETKNLYRNLGISHILVISGTHIGIIYIILFKILPIKKEKTKYFLIGIFLILYLLFTGKSVSTIRAVTMIIFIMIGKYLDKEIDILEIVNLTMLLIIIFNPWFIYDIGFQLSFSAVYSLILIKPIFDKMYFLNKKIRDLIGGTLSIFIGTLPILTYHFFYVSLLGIIMNIIVVPTVMIIIICGFLSIILGKLTIPICYYILRFYEFFGNLLLKIPNNKILIGRMNYIEIFLYYFSIAILVYYFSKRKRQRKKKVFCLLIIVLIYFLIPKKVEFNFPYVGQGDCSIIEYKDKNLVIDGSYTDKYLKKYLEYKGENTIDFAFLTHPDKDHMNGLEEILDKVKFETIFLPKINFKSEKYNDFTKNLIEKGVNIIYLKKGDKFSIGDLKVKVLHPNQNYRTNDKNGYSLVLLIEYKDFRILYTGDIGKKEEKEILKSFNFNIDLLKVAHHGSKTSSSEEFIKIIKPKISIISCGINNPYNHPHKEILKILSFSTIRRTDKEGYISVKK